MIVFLDGQFLDETKAAISSGDGGYLFGDGVFTTLRLYQGQPLDLAAHHQRLTDHAQHLDLTLETSLPALTSVCRELVQRNGRSDTDSRLRITLSRGRSGAPTLLMALGPLPADLPRWLSGGIPVLTLGAPYRRGNYPHLKTLNALPQIRALQKAAAADCPEAIILGEEGQLLEGIFSNVFLVTPDGLATPGADEPILAGRTRQLICRLATMSGLDCREDRLDGRDLARATEVFLVNSVREVVPVISVVGTPVGD